MGDGRSPCVVTLSGSGRWSIMVRMGAFLVIVALVVVIPVGVMITCAVIAAALGASLKNDVDAHYEGSEYLELS